MDSAIILSSDTEAVLHSGMTLSIFLPIMLKIIGQALNISPHVLHTLHELITH